MRGKADDSNPVMVGQTDWYVEAGRGPFCEDGFTPELMNRIEHAAALKATGHRGFRFNKNIVLTSLAMVLLIGALTFPLGEKKGVQVNSPIGHSQAAGVAIPSSSPAATAEAFDPPIGSVLFDFSGKKYYMPLPPIRDKDRALAAETSEGIIWSPPPPMVNYSKPAYTHPTEPFTLYLSSKDQPELSVTTATRLYTFPLYVGSASTYRYLNGVVGAGDYVLLSTYQRTLGSETGVYGTYSSFNVKKALAGETVVPKEFTTSFDIALLDYKSIMAVDKEREQLVFSYLEYDGNKVHDNKTVLYDLDTLSIVKLASTIGFKEIKGDALTMDYRLDGELRKADIIGKGGLGWLDENWAFLSEERQNDLYEEFMRQP
jgi:hypothetical protein